MNVGLAAQAIGLFVVTNIDDLLVLALFFGQAAVAHTSAWKVVAGQALGFAAILLLAVAGALGAGLLPHQPSPTSDWCHSR